MSVPSIAVVFSIALTAIAQAAPPQFDIATKKKEDRVTVAVANDKGTVDIHSKSGIGSATITPTSGEWPKKVIVRFHLGGLERFTVSTGITILNGSVASYGENAKRLHLSQGNER